MIGQSGVGYSFDPLVDGVTPHPFSGAAKAFARLRAVRDMVDIWDRTTKQIFEEKQKALMEGDQALASQIESAKDLLSILMKANMEASEEDKLPEKEVLGQML
ncbi:hypothetical protein C0993_004968 [Termitomyces sp. T159_Od127]|nr:hypothetical protein C0993_004968 [Termitomyces sp. T159_Od127]